MLFQCLFAGFPRDDPNQLGWSFSLPLRIVWWRGLQIEGRKSKPWKSAALESKRVLKKKIHAISCRMFFGAWILLLSRFRQGSRKLPAGSRSPSWVFQVTLGLRNHSLCFPDWRSWGLPTASMNLHSTDGSLICVLYCNGDVTRYSRTKNTLKLLGLTKHWMWGRVVDQESVAMRNLVVLECICLFSSWSYCSARVHPLSPSVMSQSHPKSMTQPKTCHPPQGKRWLRLPWALARKDLWTRS